MNRPFLTVLLSVVAFTLSACGDSGGSDAPPAADIPAPAPTPAPAPATEPAVADDVFADLPTPYNQANYAVGQRTWRLCSACHMVEEGAGHRVGPNLYGMFGRQVGTMDGFPYSDAVTEADFIWTPEVLNDWLTNPSTFLPGNRMTFAGIRKPQDRDAVIAYLMVESGWQPTPAPAE